MNYSKNRKSSALYLLVLISFLFNYNDVFSQSTLLDFNTGTLKESADFNTFQTNIADASNVDEINNMTHLDFSKLYTSKSGGLPDLSGGIIADMTTGIPGGTVTLSVYAYDETANHPTIPNAKGGKGQLIYQIYSDITSTDFVENSSMLSLNNTSWSMSHVRSNQIKNISQNLELYVDDHGDAGCQNFNMSVGERIWNSPKFLFGGKGQYYQCERYYSAVQPVIVELEFEDGAEVSLLKIPGIGEITPVALFSEPQERWLNEIDVANATINQTTNNIKISVDLINNQSTDLALSNIYFHFESLTSDNPTDYGIYPVSDVKITKSVGQHQYSDIQIADITNSPLPEDTYGAYISYTIADPNQSNSYYRHKTFLTFVRVSAYGDISVYDVPKTNYQNLPIYQLKGGMSAEYTVQKALAALDGGISHTWAVNTNSEGNPDLKEGGPVPVWGNPDFLDKSVKKTVELYNDNLGATTQFKTVIIGVGLANVPYMSYQMKAPFLPFHFLTCAYSLNEVKGMVDYANDNGYSCYATAGYDPSLPDIGVAWIKLLELPQAYKDFLKNHDVENIVFVGANEQSIGETEARKIKYTNTTNGTFDEGLVYVMDFGGDEGQHNLKAGFKDYESVLSNGQLGDRVSIADWEGGIADNQIANFRTGIKTISGINPNIYTIKGIESLDFYQHASYMALKHFEKNSATIGNDPINGVYMNEYLIGFPGYEFKRGYLPNLYWQGTPDFMIKNNLTGYLLGRIQELYPSISENQFLGLDVHFNAKYDRSPIVTALQTKNNSGMSTNDDVIFTNVTMNTWQKADVWDPSDGMNSPCEVAAIDIVNNLGGANGYYLWQQSLSPLTPDDLASFALSISAVEDRSYTRGSGHPSPNSINILKSFANEGVNIKKYEFNPNSYWQAIHLPSKIPFTDITSDINASEYGYINGGLAYGQERLQKITIAEFDLSNTSTELELQMDYKFDPKPDDGFEFYDNNNGDQQVMGCFEYVKVPKTDWLEIPSRMMAKNGAVWIVNGTVYDWDYNGLPGVVPFIKKDNDIKAQPQILSYKGEAYFAWEWGATKSVKLGHRSSALPESSLVGDLKTLYHSESSGYSNALSGMTYMTGSADYDITAYQPDWMINYPEFDPKYLGPSGTAIRCYLTNTLGCFGIVEAIGTVPFGEGWNDCSTLVSPNYVKRFSTLAYRQYDKLFDQYPNSRTFIAMKGTQLDIGIIDGDLGAFNGYGPIMNKTMGMRNWEVSNFVRYKGYDHFMHLDGGSSTQMWLNGRGPLHDPTGYPLIDDNQGPYFSRLGSTFVMLVPKKHEDQIKAHSSTNGQYLLLDNSGLSFDYDEDTDHEKDKSFVSLSPSKDDLKSEDGYGMIAGNFRIENETAAKGAVLFSMGEDMYYPDTQGISEVFPEYRNMMIVGVGKIPGKLTDQLMNMGTKNTKNPSEFFDQIITNDQSFYCLKLHEGFITQYYFDLSGSYNDYIDNQWHSFDIHRNVNSDGSNNYTLYIDNTVITGSDKISYSIASNNNMFEFDDMPVTHAMLGAVNVDGRFVTGNAKLNVDNFLIAQGLNAMNILNSTNRISIREELTNNQKFPDISSYGNPVTEAIYALEFEEVSGQHSFAINLYPSNPSPDFDKQFYGLNLNTERISYSSKHGKQVKSKDKVSIVNEIQIYPNPINSDEIFNVAVSLEAASPVQLVMYDLQGRKVWCHDEKEKTIGKHILSFENIFFKNIQSGTYILKVITKNTEKSSKIIFE